VRLGGRHEEIAEALTDAGQTVLHLGTRIFEAKQRDELVAFIGQLVNEHHRRNPLEPGAPLQTVRAQLAGRPELVNDALSAAVYGGGIEVVGGLIRRAGWTPHLSESEASLRAALVEALAAAGAEPPSVSELTTLHGAAVAPLMRILERESVLVSVESDRYYAASALETLVGRLRAGMVPGREYSPGELRDVIGVSRKFLIPFLEYCDRQGITERRPGGRVLPGT
jgi:selenocysteine-specific elongation factor